MSVDAQVLHDRWLSRRHVGVAKPTQTVKVRSVNMAKGYQTFEFLSGRKAEKMGTIQGGHNDQPWQGFLIPKPPNAEYVELPNVMQVDLDAELSQGSAKGGLSTGTSGSGMQTATIHLENLIFKAITGVLGAYNAVIRGYLSPYNGFIAASAAPLKAAGEQNQWAQVLSSGYQITIWQGYGDQTTPTFTGIIDDCDLVSQPDTITITARDFGRYLTDQPVVGLAKAREIRSPITFADRRTVNDKKKTASNEIAASKKQNWILVDDAADVVRWVLMWAGFHEWFVEDFGTSLTNPITFHQSDFLIDIINYITAQGNFVFYIDCPTDDPMSIGVPVFRECRALEAASPEMVTVTEHDLLQALEVKHSTDPLAWQILCRGAATKKGGVTSEVDSTQRFSALYFPPWSGRHRTVLGGSQRDPNQIDRLSGDFKEVSHTDVLLTSNNQCMMMAVLIAYQEALAQTEATIQSAGNPPIHVDRFEDSGSRGFHLDGQVGIFDTGTGTSSRVWIRKLSSNFTAGESPSYTHTLQGSLVDTPDIGVLTKDYAQARTRTGRKSNVNITDPGDNKEGPASGGFSATGKAPIQSGAGPEGLPIGPLPDYPHGPLGGTDWSLVHGWDAGGSVLDFAVPTGPPTGRADFFWSRAGRLLVDPHDGRLRPLNYNDVCQWGPGNDAAGPHEFPDGSVGLWGAPPTRFGSPGDRVWYCGDKWAGIWTGAPPVGGGYKVRARIALDLRLDDYQDVYFALVVNLGDRQQGLCFYFGWQGVGWIPDARVMGNVQSSLAYEGIADTHGQDVQKVRDYRDQPELFGSRLNPAISTEDTARNYIVLKAFNAAATLENLTGGAWPECYVELWRKHDNTLQAAIYSADPDSGAKPFCISTYGQFGVDWSAVNATNKFPQLSTLAPQGFRGGDTGHFGWTISQIAPGRVRGITQMRLYKSHF